LERADPAIFDALPKVERQPHWPQGWEVPQRAWNALGLSVAADIAGKSDEPDFTMRDGWRHQEVIDAARASTGWKVLPTEP